MFDGFPQRKLHCPAQPDNYLMAFLELLDDDIIQDFLWVDGCAKLADKVHTHVPFTDNGIPCVCVCAVSTGHGVCVLQKSQSLSQGIRPTQLLYSIVSVHTHTHPRTPHTHTYTPTHGA